MNKETTVTLKNDSYLNNFALTWCQLGEFNIIVSFLVLRGVFKEIIRCSKEDTFDKSAHLVPLS